MSSKLEGFEIDVLRRYDFAEFRKSEQMGGLTTELMACRGYLVRDQKVDPLPREVPENSPVNSLSYLISDAYHRRGKVCKYRLSRRGMAAIGRTVPKQGE